MTKMSNARLHRETSMVNISKLIFQPFQTLSVIGLKGRRWLRDDGMNCTDRSGQPLQEEGAVFSKS